MGIFKKLKAWRERRYWDKRKICHITNMVMQDWQWLAHDPVAAAITDRYKNALSENWFMKNHESIYSFRQKIGLDPNSPNLNGFITNKSLLSFTADAPMKQINIDGKPYLQRYYMGTTADGWDMWVHRFLSCDPDRHLHNHPFEFKTVCLHGGYTEEIKTIKGVERLGCFAARNGVKRLEFNVLSDFVSNYGRFRGIGSWHRIAKILPNTWTVLLVNRNNRVPYWYFDNDGAYEIREGSGFDWFVGKKTRAEQAGLGVVQDENPGA